MQRTGILAEQYGSSRPYTTGDVARALDVTDEGVRYLVREDQLACTRTAAGWRIFRKGDVLRLAEQRTEVRLSGVRRLRPKKIGIPGEPRQMSLLRAQLRLVPPVAARHSDHLGKVK